MARGKYNRGMAVQSKSNISTHRNSNCSCVTCKSKMPPNNCNPFGFKSIQEIETAIEYHWGTLTGKTLSFLETSHDRKHFLLENPSEMCVLKLINYWSRPQNVQCTKTNIATGMSGASWYLAHLYILLGKQFEARSMILNGAFLQQCSLTSISQIAELFRNMAALAHNSTDSILRDTLPFYRRGLAATSSMESMVSFLKTVMSPTYHRMMGFKHQQACGADYVSMISHGYSGPSSTSQQKNTKNVDTEDTEIDIALVDVDRNEEVVMKIGSSTPLKVLVQDYAEKRGVSTRSLRLTTQFGKTLFLSSDGRKTPKELGLDNFCTINVTLAESSSQTNTSHIESATKEHVQRRAPVQCSKKRKVKGTSKKTHSLLAIQDNDKVKIAHSLALTRLFEEAEPRFKEIRQKLNALNLERTPSKQKNSGKSSASMFRPIMNPTTECLGGKAGKTSFVVHIGEVENLYKTTKPSNRRSQTAHHRPIMVDLHGNTREEAISKLDVSLPEWSDIAMQGSYPFVVPVVIVCGGGSQLLSEAVGDWIRSNDKVANAPKNHFLNKPTFAHAA